jgi:hypothetical protein
MSVVNTPPLAEVYTRRQLAERHSPSTELPSRLLGAEEPF